MKHRAGLASSVLALTFAFAPGTALATEELHEGASPLAITVPDGWALSVDGAWALADAPDHKARVRIAAHGTGVLADLAAETYLINFIADTWATYTVDKHVRHVQCGRYVGLELYGHGSGDTWDRAKFHLYLLIDPGSPQKGVVVLVSGSDDTWDTMHPALDRAVHALHGT